MASNDQSTTDIKIFAGLGVFALIALIAVPLIGLGYVVKEASRHAECQTRSDRDAGCERGPLWGFFDQLAEENRGADEGSSPGLGEEGAVCGGPNLLPCLPGLMCAAEEAGGIGICSPSL